MPRAYKTTKTIIRRPTTTQPQTRIFRMPTTPNTILKPTIPTIANAIVPKRTKTIIRTPKSIGTSMPIFHNTNTGIRTVIKSRIPIIYHLSGVTINSTPIIIPMIIGLVTFFIIKNFMLFSIPITAHSLITIQLLCLAYTAIKYISTDKDVSKKSSEEIQAIQTIAEQLTGVSATFIVVSLTLSLFATNTILIYLFTLPVLALTIHSITTQNKTITKLEKDLTKTKDSISQNTQHAIQQEDIQQPNESEQTTILNNQSIPENTKRQTQDTSTEAQSQTSTPPTYIQQTQLEQTQSHADNEIMHERTSALR